MVFSVIFVVGFGWVDVEIGDVMGVLVEGEVEVGKEGLV